jgi:hypothetical protein
MCMYRTPQLDMGAERTRCGGALGRCHHCLRKMLPPYDSHERYTQGIDFALRNYWVSYSNILNVQRSRHSRMVPLFRLNRCT